MIVEDTSMGRGKRGKTPVSISLSMSESVSAFLDKMIDDLRQLLTNKESLDY